MGLIEDFKAGLYEEHLDEAGFLYEQRARFREDPSLRCDDVIELEQRLEANLDGLFLGGELALKHCAALLDVEDPGSVFSVLALYCRQGAASQISELIERVAGEGDDLLLAAASEALCLELRPEDRALALQGLASLEPRTLALWGRVIGFQRLPFGEQLRSALAHAPHAPHASASAVLVWALGELQHAPAAERLRELVGEPDPQLGAAAAIALGKLQGALTARPALASLEQPMAAIMQGTLGHDRLVALARAAGKSAPVEAVQAIAALGLEADPRSVPVLLELMAEQPLAAACAQALHMLTGASLLEAVSVDQSDQSADLDPDLAAVTPDADEEALAVRRLSQNQEQWQHWLHSHAQSPASSARIRMGQPLGLAATLTALTSTSVPMSVRRILCDELRIRTRHSLTLQPELPMIEQRSLLAQLQRTAAACNDQPRWTYPI